MRKFNKTQSQIRGPENNNVHNIFMVGNMVSKIKLLMYIAVDYLHDQIHS